MDFTFSVLSLSSTACISALAAGAAQAAEAERSMAAVAEARLRLWSLNIGFSLEFAVELPERMFDSLVPDALQFP
jgi:hypothetical protein